MAYALEDEVYRQVVALITEGNNLANQGRYDAAKGKFLEAFHLLPEPKARWEATTWIIASIGDMWFFLRDLAKASDAFNDAVKCPNGLGNTFIHLRLGEIAFEAGDMKRAGDQLTRAYMGGGREAFKAEDPKYFRLLESILTPPKGQHRL